jgi:3-dehydroquinate dehydratase/shikimate dehydrogenase
VTVERLSQSLALRDLGRACGNGVYLAMGDAGIPSRVLAAQFGSRWTYAGDGVAPGQLPAQQLLEELAFDRVTGSTAVYGVVGRPVLHSLSPAMHNAAFRAAKLDAVYVPLAAADFHDFTEFAAAIDLRGASVTAPFKVAAFQDATRRDQLSQRVGAVNTLVRANAEWDAFNTDVAGFLAPLQSRMDVAGKRVTVLGAGGAALAVLEALTSSGARVSVAARDERRAAHLARWPEVTLVGSPPPPGSWDVLVNATPVGTAPNVDESPLPSGPFDGELVYDLVYNPIDTRLLRDARAAGCQTVGGLDMLVEQAERQFEIWTGTRPAPGLMRAAALRASRNRATSEAVATPVGT